MAKLQISFKRLAIDKATKTILGILIGASVITVFALAGSRSLFAQVRYQNKVINTKQEAERKLQENIDAVNSLVEAYQAFDNSSESIIGTAEKNSKIVLDALPSKYDFPALTSSLEKLLAGYSISSISGSDDEVAQGSTAKSAVVEIPFSISVSSSYQSIQKLISDFDKSIRPIQLINISLSGGESNMTLTLSAKTYYQARKTLEFITKEIQ